MPKRIVDGESLWTSDKLALLPTWARPEYANLIPLARANGSFECDPRKVWSRVYAYNRADVSPERVVELLAEMERAKMLFRWHEPDGKEWGYFVGIGKPGRLPSESRQKKKHETIGAVPPPDQLLAFLQSTEQPMASHKVANGDVGFGTGFGTGTGNGNKTSSSKVGHQNTPQPPNPPLSEVKSTSDQEGARSVSQSPHSGKKLENQEAADRLTTLFTERILANNRSAKIKSAGWPQIADKMIRLDGRSEAEIAEVIEWCQRDPFWQSNILSMEKLRLKFDQLTMKIKSNGTVKPAAPDLNGMEYGKGPSDAPDSLMQLVARELRITDLGIKRSLGEQIRLALEAGEDAEATTKAMIEAGKKYRETKSYSLWGWRRFFGSDEWTAKASSGPELSAAERPDDWKPAARIDARRLAELAE